MNDRKVARAVADVQAPAEKRGRLLLGAVERVLLSARLLDRRITDPNWQGDTALLFLRMRALDAGFRLALFDAERREP